MLDAIGLCDAYPLEYLGVDIIGSVSGSGLWGIAEIQRPMTRLVAVAATLVQTEIP